MIYRFTFFFFAGLTFAFAAKAQNLVPNGSFEERSECIWNDSNINFAPPWFNPQPTGFELVDASPDVYHYCANVSSEPCPYPISPFLDSWGFGVPTNAIGCENPQSGEGYAGLFCFIWNPDPVDGYREYLSVPLSNELIEGEIYDVSLWASLAERATHAIWNLQVVFSEEPVVQGWQAEPMTNVQPQLNGTPGTYIDTRDGWLEVSWEYIAEGGESYLTIGNFELNSQTDTLRVVFGDMENHYFPGVYYYIDDVSVIRQSLSGQDNYAAGRLEVYPIPAEESIVIKSSENLVRYVIYSIDGKRLSEVSVSSSKVDVNISGFPSGMYILQAEFSNGAVVSKKIVKR